MLRRLGGAVLVAACAYTGADAAADSAMYMRARSLVMAQAASNERFQAQLGSPLHAGPWYSSSVVISHDGHIATVTMPVRGSRRSSDVTVRVARTGGLRSTLLYNLVGGGEWDVLVMSALVGMGPGGIPVSMSLLEQQVPNPEAAAAAAAAAGHACLPCMQQAAAGGDGSGQQQAAVLAQQAAGAEAGAGAAAAP